MSFHCQSLWPTEGYVKMSWFLLRRIITDDFLCVKCGENNIVKGKLLIDIQNVGGAIQTLAQIRHDLPPTLEGSVSQQNACPELCCSIWTHNKHC